MYYRWRLHRDTVPSTIPVVVGMLGLFAVLLVVFLICGQRVSMPGTSINLPRFDNEASNPVPKHVVSVTKGGDIFFNAEKLDTDGLHNALNECKKKSGQEDWVVVFYADKEAPLGFIAKLFDIARGVEFNAYLATDGMTLRSTPSHAPAQDDKTL